MEIKIEKAKKLYDQSPDWFKEDLIEAFGKKCFELRDFRSIKTFEDACESLGISLSHFYAGETPDEIAYKKLKIIARAVNQGWIPDWDNTNQKKWWPWFNLSSGFGFSYSDYLCGNTHPAVGSRLCYESEEKSDYVAKQFINLYEEFLTLKS